MAQILYIQGAPRLLRTLSITHRLLAPTPTPTFLSGFRISELSSCESCLRVQASESIQIPGRDSELKAGTLTPQVFSTWLSTAWSTQCLCLALSSAWH